MKIGVIGLGLIGGSIFKSLSSKYDVIGISSSVKQECVFSDYNVLKDCDALVSIFVLGDKEVKKARIMQKYDKNEFMAERMMI